jgi:hypothetical protein
VFFLTATLLVVFLAAVQRRRADRMLNEALTIAGGLFVEPFAVAGWRKLVE